MSEETDKFTENENPTPVATQQDLQENLNGLQEALAGLTALAGTVEAASKTAKKKTKKKRG